jgi:hypothetical protein
MSELDNMIAQASVEVEHHTEAMLRQRVATLLSEPAQRVLDLRFDTERTVVIIGCLGVPCWIERAPDGGNFWQFGCPWWRSIVPEDKLFESRLLAEVGRVKLHVDGILEKLDPKQMN